MENIIYEFTNKILNREDVFILGGLNNRVLLNHDAHMSSTKA